jgi:hypothetical protein
MATNFERKVEEALKFYASEKFRWNGMTRNGFDVSPFRPKIFWKSYNEQNVIKL